MLEQLKKSIQSFEEITMEAENRQKLYRYNDALMQSLHSILEDHDSEEDSKMQYLSETLEQYASAMKELLPQLIKKSAEDPTEDPSNETPPPAEPEEPPKKENPIGKSDPDRFDEIVEIEKFNPYHDNRGRFTTAGGAASFTYAPGKSKAHDNAIAREKQRHAAEEAAKPKFTFTPAKTKKEAVAYATSELGFQKASYGTKLDIDTINHINEQIARVQQQYPEVKGAVSELKTWSHKTAYAAIETQADGSMKFLIGTNQYGQGLDAVKKQYANDVSTGFHPTGTDAGSIVYHEYGHVLANISTKQSMGVSAKGNVAANYDERLKFIRSRKSNSVEKEWLFEAAKTTGSKPSEIMKTVSRYAQKNPAETFAEAFSEVMGSASPRKESVELVKASGWYR